MRNVGIDFLGQLRRAGTIKPGFSRSAMLRWLAAALLAASAPGFAEDSNPRFEFLRMNLGVFPGTDRIFEADWTMFWKLKANLAAVRAAERLPAREYPFRISTDATGRRITPKPPADTSSVLFLGDSCTFGIPVNDHEAFPARVGKSLGVHTVNAGVPGYTIFQGRLLLDNLRDRPNAVVIAFWPNELGVWDHLSDREHFDLLAAQRASEFSRLSLTKLLRRATPGTRPRLSEEEFEAELTAAIARSRQIAAAPLLVVWPFLGQMDGEADNPRQTVIRKVAAKHHVPTVDLAPDFRRHGGKRLFADRIHATAEGYGVAAEAIAAALKPLLQRSDRR